MTVIDSLDIVADPKKLVTVYSNSNDGDRSHMGTLLTVESVDWPYVIVKTLRKNKYQEAYLTTMDLRETEFAAVSKDFAETALQEYDGPSLLGISANDYNFDADDELEAHVSKVCNGFFGKPKSDDVEYDADVFASTSDPLLDLVGVLNNLLATFFRGNITNQNNHE